MESQPFVAEARTYYVKGCAPKAHQLGDRVEVTPMGFRDNRRFMVTEWDEGLGHERFISQRIKHGGERLALVQPDIQGDTLILRADGMQECRVPTREWSRTCQAEVQDDLVAVFEHPEGSKWMSDFLHRKCHLMQQSGPRRIGHPAVPNHAEISLADRHPILAIGRKTIERVRELVLQKRGMDLEVQELIDAFRPNLVLDGIGPKEEHNIASAILGDGVLFGRSVQCNRCDVPDVDQRTGERRHGIVAAISEEFRNGKEILLGEQFRPITTGHFTVGDHLRNVIWKQGGFERPFIPRKPQ